MAQHQHKPQVQLEAETRFQPKTRAIRLADHAEPGEPSPARELQARLNAALEDEPQIERWPLAFSVPLIVGASAVLWLGVISVARMILQ